MDLETLTKEQKDEINRSFRESPLLERHPYIRLDDFFFEGYQPVKLHLISRIYNKLYELQKNIYKSS